MPTNSTLIAALSFCAYPTGERAPRGSCTDNGRLLESRELAQGLKEEAGTSRVEKNPAGQQCSYCAGLARGWPFSAIKKTSTLVGPVVLVFFASWTTLAGLWNTSPAL